MIMSSLFKGAGSLVWFIAVYLSVASEFMYSQRQKYCVTPERHEFDYANSVWQDFFTNLLFVHLYASAMEHILKV